MTAIDRTAYPRLGRGAARRELQDSFTPTAAEVVWARERVGSASHLLALVVLLKAFGRLGYFPRLGGVPAGLVEHVRGCLGLGEGVVAEHDSERTLRHHRALIRERLGVVHDPERVRALVEQAIRMAVETKDNPADLINVALEELVRARCELPGYSTLDRSAARIRAEVNGALHARVAARMSDTDAARLDALLELDPRTRRTAFDELKRPAGAATVSRLREHLAHLGWLDGLGETEAWLEGVPPAKVAHFAGQARVTDAGDLRRVGDPKRQVLIACLLHLARVRARDDVVTMFCKRIAALHTKARQRLEALREQHRADSERLIAVFGDVLGVVRAALDDDRAAGEPPGVVCERAGRRVLDALAAAGGVEELTSTQEAVAAHHGDNWLALLERPYRSHRAVLFTLLDALELEPTSVDRRVLDAVAFLQANRRRTGELISDQLGHARLDLSFASEAWRRLVRDSQRPGKLVRRHLETCVFSYLAAELRSGDIAVAGSESYANFRDQLLTVRECEPLVAGYCAEAGLPSDAGAFTAALRRQLEQVAAGVDAGYPDNADLVIDEHGRPTLRRRRGKDRRPSALALERAVLDRLPERGLLDVLARSAHFVGWQRHFGPVSGSDPKLSDALGRYVLLAFCHGTNLGPSQVARHMRGTVTARELTIAATHAPADKIHAASADVINAYSELDLPALWGDGASAGVDGTQVDTWENNVLAETSIRYGGYGGIAYRHISDTYIALFSHFIPCGVWEAVYLIEGLLRNDSAVQPEVIHGDTQSQSLPVFGLAHMLGFELLPRIRNWADLILYRPSRDTRYEHIDALFAPDAVIDWNLIETHWPDLMRVALSIREGRISSATLLRRLGHDSRRNRLYRAFRELGRVVRTIVLLRYLSEPELRDGIAIMTNRVEAFHGFSDWLMFGGAVLADNDPDHHERIVKFNELLANCAIYHTTRDITAAANQLLADGWTIDPDDLATIAPTSRARSAASASGRSTPHHPPTPSSNSLSPPSASFR